MYRSILRQLIDPAFRVTLTILNAVLLPLVAFRSSGADQGSINTAYLAVGAAIVAVQAYYVARLQSFRRAAFFFRAGMAWVDLFLLSVAYFRSWNLWVGILGVGLIIATIWFIYGSWKWWDEVMPDP